MIIICLEKNELCILSEDICCFECMDEKTCKYKCDNENCSFYREDENKYPGMIEKLFSYFPNTNQISILFLKEHLDSIDTMFVTIDSEMIFGDIQYNYKTTPPKYTCVGNFKNDINKELTGEQLEEILLLAYQIAINTEVIAGHGIKINKLENGRYKMHMPVMNFIDAYSDTYWLRSY